MSAKEKNPAVLPEGYRELTHIDLQKNKKEALIVNGLGLVVMLVLGVLGHLVVPIQSLFDMEQGFGVYCARFGVLIVGIVVYMVLHEAVHGVCMMRFSTVKPHYGFTGMYAFAGSEAYFSRPYYIVIALAPVVVWGVVLAVLCALVPAQWFWVAYFIQITNLSGAAGDLYVTARMMRMPEDILVQDAGTSMTVYSRQA